MVFHLILKFIYLLCLYIMYRSLVYLLHTLNRLIFMIKQRFRRPTMIYVLGSIGAGKTTYINTILSKKYPTYKKVIFDDIMTNLDSFKTQHKPIVSWPPQSRSLCYTQAMDVVSETIKDIISKRQSFIIEGTGMNVTSNVKDMIHQKHLGYKLVIYHLQSDVKVCLDRVTSRNMDSNRKIDMKTVYVSYDLLQINIETYANLVDTVITIPATKSNT